MKKKALFALIIILSVVITSCSGKRKELAENVTKEFFAAIKADNDIKLKELYPDLDKISSYYKSDEIVIKETKILDNKDVCVTVKNTFTNGFGKKFDKEISLFLKEEENNNDIFKIYDSKGLSGFEEKDEYKFAVKTGIIEKNTDLTDQQIAQKFEIASKMVAKYSFETLIQLRSEVAITSWNWETGYGGSASGKGIVKNNSTFSIPSLKYKVTYFDRNDNEITSDNGYVSYDKLEPGSSKSFTFYTSYVGNASTAQIVLDFDFEMIYKYLINKNYTGKEYQEYLASEKEEDKI